MVDPMPRRRRGARLIAGIAAALLWSCSDASGGAVAGVEAPAPPLDPATEVLVTGQPCGIAHLDGSVWVTDLSADRLVRIDVATRTISGTFPVARSPCWVLATPEGLWVAPSEEGFVQVVDPATGLVSATVDVSSGAADAKLAAGFGDVWATATPEGDVVRIDAQDLAVTARIHVGKDPRSVVVGGGRVWVAVEGSNRVVAIDPATNRVDRRFRVPAPSAILVATKRSVWAGQLLARSASKLRSEDGRVVRTYPLEGNLQPGELIGGEVWSPDHLHDEVLRLPSGRGEVGRIEVGTYPSALVRIGDEVWVANFGDGTISIVDVPDS